jgi:Domain of unknown function (DUF397)
VNGWRKSSFSFSNGNCAEVAAWRTSTASAGNGACAEVDAWRKSSASGYNGNCAEVGQDGTVVLVRDTKDRAGAWLAFSAETWAEFTERLKSA